MGPPELTVYVTLRKIPKIDIRICLQRRRLPAIKEMWVPSLGQEDPLEKGILQPTPVFLPGKSHRQRILAGYIPWD